MHTRYYYILAANIILLRHQYSLPCDKNNKHKLKALPNRIRVVI